MNVDIYKLVPNNVRVFESKEGFHMMIDTIELKKEEIKPVEAKKEEINI